MRYFCDNGKMTQNAAKDIDLVYGCHAYRIAPYTDKYDSTKFFVENPWNATQNSIMSYEKLQEYFEVICIAKYVNI